jgi:acetyltransferase-like isoleucine patch superfamily enzyme
MKETVKRVIGNSLLFQKLIEFLIFHIAQYKKNKKITLLEKQATIDSSCRLIELRLDNGLNDKTKISIAKNSMINRAHLLVYGHGGEISVGEYCFIGEGTKIWSSKRIKIGNRVLISHGVNIHDNNSHPLDSELRHKDFVEIFHKGMPKTANYNEQEIIIEDDVWIGFNATILKGVTIGEKSIIGANTVVVKDVPPKSIVVGNPQRIIKNAN